MADQALTPDERAKCASILVQSAMDTKDISILMYALNRYQMHLRLVPSELIQEPVETPPAGVATETLPEEVRIIESVETPVDAQVQ